MTKRKKNTAQKVLDYAKRNPSGFTARLKNGKIRKVRPSQKKRYAVSTTNLTSKKAITKKFKNKKSGIFGGWYDKKSKKYYIDETKLVSSKKKATKIGKRHNQKAIFDLLKMREIRI